MGAHYIRIGIIAAGEIFGGAERQILTLMSALRARTERPAELIVFHDRELAARARERDFAVHVLGVRSLVDAEALRRLRTVLSNVPFDVLSVHGYRAATYLALTRMRVRIPVMKTEHGRMEADTGRFADDFKTRAYRWLENFAARRLRATLVYVTQDLQRQCATEHRGMRQRVIYNGIDISNKNETSRPVELNANGFNLVMVGRLERVKAVDLAIRAMAESSMPPQTHLYVIGSGPDLASLQGLAGECGVAPRVSLLGFRANVYDYIAHADCMLLPSRHEGLPYTLLEALSLETPVIATRVGGLAEVLTPDHDALVIDPLRPVAIAQAVRQLTESSDLGQSLKRAGLQLVRSRFSADAMANGYATLAQELVESRRS